MFGFIYLTILLASTSRLSLIQACNRAPQGATAAKSPVDDNFVLSVAGNAQSYVSGQKYNDFNSLNRIKENLTFKPPN